MNKLVSVVIPTFKREFGILDSAISSVIKQSYENIEIIIVDDNELGSHYSQLIKKGISKYENINYLSCNGNKGACFARNLGIKNSKGEFVAFLDDDDTWEPTKIEKQIKMFSDGVGMVFCKGYMISKKNGETPYYTSDIFMNEVSFEDLLYRDYIGSTSQALILKDVFDEVGYFDINFPARQDYDLWIRISKKYRIVGIDEELFTHYKHYGEQITGSSKRALEAYIMIYNKYKKYYEKDRNLKARIFYMISRYSKRERKHLKLFQCYFEILRNNPKFFFDLVYEHFNKTPGR